MNPHFTFTVVFGPAMENGFKIAATGENVPGNFYYRGNPLIALGPNNLIVVYSTTDIDGNKLSVNGVEFTASKSLAKSFGMNNYFVAQLSDNDYETLAGAKLPPPMAPAVPELVSHGRTPAETANRRFRSMINVYQHYRRQKSALSWSHYREYTWCRANRNTTKSWKRYQKDALVQQITKSYNNTRNWVNAWTMWCDWFDAQVVTENDFMAYHGITSVDSTGSSSFGEGLVTWSWRDRFESDVRVWKSFASKIRERVDDVREQLEMVDLTDPIQSLEDEIVSATSELGLESHEEFNARDDGFLWFTHPENDRLYRLRLSHLNYRGSGYRVSHEYGVREYAGNWMDNEYVSLELSALGVDVNTGGSSPDRSFV